jgi:peptidyl-prolyl cis-trans isomerase SurA
LQKIREHNFLGIPALTNGTKAYKFNLRMRLTQVFSGLLLTALLVSGCKTSKETATTTPVKNKEVLFTVDATPYYTDEFIRVYNKNLDLVKDDSQKDLDNYLNLFVGYKLKVAKANQLGLQNNKKYQGELKSYRSQLAKTYLSDTKVTNELVEEAYQHGQKEIRASHILFLVDENALPADTLKAYNKAVDVRKKIQGGEDFDKLAVQYSEDPSAKENKGDLGYFSAFRMVYQFEQGAYKTPKGQVSQPVRTRFGYHLIKVTDIRDNRGDISVAHIMIAKPKTADVAAEAKAKATIDEIYQKLNQGEDFAMLAKQFSQDKGTAANGGVLNRFSSGELSSTEFEDASFALTAPGQYSKPFETTFGWHIVKLIEKYPMASFEDSKAGIETRVRKDDRSKLIATSLTENLRKKYPVKTDKKVFEETVALMNDSIYKQSWKLPANAATYTKTLFTINKDRAIPASAFLDFINAQQKLVQPVKPLTRLADVLLEKFINEQVNVYYNDNLEKEFPEFAIVMDEYRDGLLLFDLMEKEIWEKAKNDTIGLQKYYQDNISKYQWKDRLDAEVFSSTSQESIKQAAKYLAQGKDAAFIKSKLNTKEKVAIMEKSGVFEKDTDALPKQLKLQTGISEVITEGNYFYVVKVNKVLPAGPKSLEDAKGRVINDYQQYLESTWVDGLKKEFTVKVNQGVFEKVKTELKH